MKAADRPGKDETRARIKALHAEGMARNAIARELGLAASTVGAHARALGLKFDRSATKAATEAKLTDLGARRAALVASMMDLAEDTMAAVKGGKFQLVQITQAGKIVKTEREVDMTDRRNAMVIGGIAIDKATKLLDRDSGLEGASSTLDALESLIGAAPARALQDGEQTTD